MPEKDKIPVAIYQLDRSLYEEMPFTDVVEVVVDTINRKASGRTWEPEPINVKDYPDQVRIYSSTATMPPGWRKFLSPALAKNSKLQVCVNVIHGFLCFVDGEPDIFLITGGMGAFHAIDEHVYQHFGLDVLVRIIEKSSPVIRGIGDRGVTGILLGQSRNFREDQRLSNEDAFGRIYKEVKADLQQRILVKDFRFSKESLKRIKSGCLAKTSFKINKSISFPELIHLTKAFGTLLKRDPKFALNKVNLIDKRKKQNHGLLQALNEHFVEHLYQQYKKGQPFDVDLLNKEYEKYLDASTYVFPLNDEEEVEFDDAPTLQELIDELVDADSLFTDGVEDFKHSVMLKQLTAKDEEGIVLTSESVLKQLHGELKHDRKNYFYVDEDWYEVHPTFTKDLNRECEEIIKECWDSTLIGKVFDVKEEGDYNLKFVGEPGWLVLDTITPENIELCDLLHYTDDHLYLVHVKQGFDNSLRDLTAQMSIAANRLHEDSRNQYLFVESVQARAVQGLKSTSGKSKLLAEQAFPAGGLPELFKRTHVRNVCFCLAVVDTAKADRSLDGDLSAFNSNIAKYFLVQLYRAINALRFDFKVIQLKRQ
jgi:uncharacterized protein (TIGR04141 family)